MTTYILALLSRCSTHPGLEHQFDGDFGYVRDGMMAVNTSNNRFYVRIGGTWRYG